MPDFAFAGYPAPFIFEEPGKKKLQQLIWGDFVRLRGEPDAEGWVPVHSRRTDGFMRKKELQDERLLEVGFVDIGQGDGTFAVLPDDRFLLIDAGQTDNMLRFLSWRFNLRRNRERVINFDHAVISHPDQDHYKGFASLFASGQFKFGTLFHNGIVERAGAESLGPRHEVNGVSALADVIRDDAQLKARLEDADFVKGKAYPQMLAAGLKKGVVDKLVGLSVAHGVNDGFLPGFEADKELSIQVLGPWPEDDDAGSLRWFGDVGKTKNGHSVVLKLSYRNVKLLLGGDLNIPAEQHLLARHAQQPLPADGDEAAEAEFLAKAKAAFEVDIAKACHHGSADFTSLYLRAVNPIATVISSGDDEPHAHPRPDALGAFGKYGRGERPLIFSTELARSTQENIRDPQALKQELLALMARRDSLDDADRRATVATQIERKLDALERSVAVYGLINLRTDGKRVLMAQKLERPRGTGEEWDVYRLEPDGQGRLRVVSKHED